jgi:Sigma-70 region 2
MWASSVTAEEFGRLYACEQPLLIRQFRSRYRELADEADDVVQDAFAKLWSSRGIDGQSLEIREVYRKPATGSARIRAPHHGSANTSDT